VFVENVHPEMKFAFILFLFVCNATAQIQRGRKAKPGQFPYAVQVHKKKPNLDIDGQTNELADDTNICTGVIIDANFVLTATHCVRSTQGVTNYDVWIVAGDVHSARFKENIIPHYHLPTAKRQADNVIHHPAWDLFPNWERIVGEDRPEDIALIYFADPLPIHDNPFISKIEIGRFGMGHREPQFGDDCTIMGWGMTRWERANDGINLVNHRDPSWHLLWARAMLAHGSHCSQDFNHELHYCVNTDPEWGALPLKGDSGGPLVCQVGRRDEEGELVPGTKVKHFLYGIARTGIIRIVGDSTATYMKLDSYVGWINKRKAEMEGKKAKSEVVRQAENRRAEIDRIKKLKNYRRRRNKRERAARAARAAEILRKHRERNQCNK